MCVTFDGKYLLTLMILGSSGFVLCSAIKLLFLCIVQKDKSQFIVMRKFWFGVWQRSTLVKILNFLPIQTLQNWQASAMSLQTRG